MKKQSVDFSLFLLICIILILLSSVGAMVFFSVHRDGSIIYTDNGGIINTLFVFEDGVRNENDNTGDAAGGESRPLCSYLTLQYPPTKRAAVFNIPGDTGRILSKVNRVDRIDTVYRKESPRDFIGEIETLLDIDVHYYIVFSLESLEKVIDLLDGVPVTIPNDIEIYNGDDSVLFPAGRTVLDGDKSIRYITKSSPEITVLKDRQDRFFLGFFRKLGDKTEYLKKAQVRDVFSSLVRTNMSNSIKEKMFSEISKTNMDRTSVLDVEGVYREVSGKKLFIPAYDATLVKDIVRKTFASLTRERDNGRRVTIEVLNGTNIPGLASRTSELIRAYGYDVIKIDNAESADYASTEIIARIDQNEEIKTFSDYVNCKNIKNGTAETDFDINTRNYETKADFTLILGRDFNAKFSR